MGTRKSEGFTLIEVVFSGLVFAISFMGLSAAMAQGTRLNDSARQELAIANATRSVLAEVNDTPFEELVERYANKGFDVEGLNTTKGDEDGYTGKILVENVDGVDGLKKITLMVEYQSGGDNRVIRHVQYVTSAIAFGNVGGESSLPSEPSQLVGQ